MSQRPQVRTYGNSLVGRANTRWTRSQARAELLRDEGGEGQLVQATTTVDDDALHRTKSGRRKYEVIRCIDTGLILILHPATRSAKTKALENPGESFVGACHLTCIYPLTL